jgi:hypothetical protein
LRLLEWLVELTVHVGVGFAAKRPASVIAEKVIASVPFHW